MENGWIIGYKSKEACYFHKGKQVSLCGKSSRDYSELSIAFRITELEEAGGDTCPACKDELVKHLRARQKESQYVNTSIPSGIRPR